MRIAVAGSSGLIGTELVSSLQRSGHDVLRLVRHAPSGADQLEWQPESSGLAEGALEGVDAVVNLCGVGIADRPWSGQFRQELRDSRLVPTRTLADAIERCGVGVFVSGSATGFYGDTGSRHVDESAPAGEGFLASLTTEWEKAACAVTHARVALLRTAPVISPSGGLLGKLRPLFKLGLGGRLGNGHQYFPWISLADEVAAIEYLITNEISGPVNATGPQEVTNREFTKAFARSVHRPAIFAVPAPVLRLAAGDLAREMLLGGQRVTPSVLTDHGFTFTHPTIDAACAYANA